MLNNNIIYCYFCLQKFHFPLIVVSCHLVWKFVLSIIVRCLYHKTMKIPFVKIPWNVKVSKFLPIGISSGIDVGFSNWGLELINVSLYVVLISWMFLLVFEFFYFMFSGIQ